MEKSKCLVVLSGGQDSTTCLYWAKLSFDEVHAVTFNYGQRHGVEIESAEAIAELAGVASHEIIDLGPILAGTSPLTDHSREVGEYKDAESLPGGVEDTFVPARNILFLTIAANRAYCLGIRDMITGVCEEDFGGYFDCRRDFIDAMEKALGEGIHGTPHSFNIRTPLMFLSKKESVELANSLPDCMEALAFSHTCYKGEYPPCGKCHACLLRLKGFQEAGVLDPLTERAWQRNWERSSVVS